MAVETYQYDQISIHALREEGDRGRREPPKACTGISIHALREEGDTSTLKMDLCSGISIHALREEGDYVGGRSAFFKKLFLSTPSARRATGSALLFTTLPRFLSTPSARRATYRARLFEYLKRNFYPRPPRGGRRGVQIPSLAPKLFLSTPSARRATSLHRLRSRRKTISIHALREEGDCSA